VKKYRILNLYAGIGGNRKLWDEPLKEMFGNNYEIVAIEYNQEIVDIYKDFFPNDTVIVTDAHQYLLEHFKSFDFIWSSPPCQTHSRINKNFGIVRYADMNLYQEIILLDVWFNGKYCVENVIPYYTPLILPQQHNRHLFWCNFKIETTSKKNPPKQMMNIQPKNSKRKKLSGGYYKAGKIKSQPDLGFDLSNIKNETLKKKVLKNCVNPETSLMILQRALEIKTQSDINEPKLF